MRSEYIYSMLVRLEDQVQHFPGRRAAFVEEFCTYCEQLWERDLDDAVEIVPVVPALEAVYPTDGQQTVQTGKNLIGVA